MDLSVAPELAQFAQPGPVDLSIGPAADGAAPGAPSGGGPARRSASLGDRAAALAALAADPTRWWDKVRFDPAAPVRIPLDGRTWLLVTPPGHATTCDCGLATLVAGEATSGGAPLRPGRTRVHARPGPHSLRSGGAGYSVTIHASLSA
jgi:hypothetical protein